MSTRITIGRSPRMTKPSGSIPNSPRRSATKGLAWLGKNDHGKALADFDEAIRLRPDLAIAYDNRGLAWAAAGDADKPIEAYNHAIRLNPNGPYPYANRGEICGRTKDYPRALADINEAIKRNPAMAEAFDNRGLVSYRSGATQKGSCRFRRGHPADAGFREGIQQPRNVQGCAGRRRRGDRRL